MANTIIAALRILGLLLGLFITYRIFTVAALDRNDRLVFVVFTLIALFMTLRSSKADSGS